MVFLVKAVGRRKEAVAQVQIKQGTGQFIINNKPAQEYLQNDFYSLLSVKAPFDALSISKQTDTVNKSESALSLEGNAMQFPDGAQNLIFDTIVVVKGGGLMGQTEAIRLGISRALCLLATNTNSTSKNSSESPSVNLNLNFAEGESLSISSLFDIRKQLKDKGYLTQDSRVKERRKYGLKKARKASQYHKR
uniref:Small ribosomal subunit protein uS9c n=1 Tax=Colemanosphaera charkowiensis TaxID=51706 RepID=A0A6C0RX91_9CHLO|nr:ribosomal protein S9 [Colemanosphaera charkowiensis]